MLETKKALAAVGNEIKGFEADMERHEETWRGIEQGFLPEDHVPEGIKKLKKAVLTTNEMSVRLLERMDKMVCLCVACFLEGGGRSRACGDPRDLLTSILFLCACACVCVCVFFLGALVWYIHKHIANPQGDDKLENDSQDAHCSC